MRFFGVVDIDATRSARHEPHIGKNNHRCVFIDAPRAARQPRQQEPADPLWAPGVRLANPDEERVRIQEVTRSRFIFITKNSIFAV